MAQKDCRHLGTSPEMLRHFHNGRWHLVDYVKAWASEFLQVLRQ